MKNFLGLATLTCILLGCSDANDSFAPAPEAPEFAAIPTPTLETPPDAGNAFVQALGFDLALVGYEAEEFFLRGTATSFTNTTELTNDGLWTVEPFDTAPFRTRMVVHRPSDPADFSGTVIVEWLNVSAGLDSAPGYVAAHTEIHNAGHAWVGVSAQVVGIEGSPGSFPLNLKAVNPQRYRTLVHPGDQYSYDMFTQVVGALRNPGPLDPLAGLVPEVIWATGESQSAFRMTTYINALQPYYNTFDGYLVFSRGGSGAPLQPGDSFSLEGAQQIRADVNVPVLTFQAETDLFGLGYFPARQPDSANFRLWEVAGTAHADVYTVITGGTDVNGAPRFAEVLEQNELAGFIQCDKPFNAGPMHYVLNAAVRALENWIRSGDAPAAAPRLDTNDAGTDFLRDVYGNTTGGIRTPHVDAPVATLRGDGNSGGGFCRLFGTTELFSADRMASLYVDAAGYTAAVRKAADEAVARGHLLPEDAAAIIAWAPQQWARQVGP